MKLMMSWSIQFDLDVLVADCETWTSYTHNHNHSQSPSTFNLWVHWLTIGSQRSLGLPWTYHGFMSWSINAQRNYHMGDHVYNVYCGLLTCKMENKNNFNANHCSTPWWETSCRSSTLTSYIPWRILGSGGKCRLVRMPVLGRKILVLQGPGSATCNWWELQFRQNK